MSDKAHNTTLQERVGAWGEATFPDSTPWSIFLHLRDEVVTELGPVIRRDTYPDGEPLDFYREIAEEAADALLLLLHIAHRYGFDLMAEAEQKFGVVQTRTYTTDSGRGYVRHDEETA